jgi:hypothetical protein
MGAAATSRLRFGRQLHCVALMSQLTSKCRRKVCQAESGISRDLFCGEDHIFNGAAAATAGSGVEVPICGADVGGGRVAEGAGDAVDRDGAAFEFEECADGRFIQVQVQAAKTKTGAVFLVVELRLEAQTREGGAPIAGVAGDCFPFEAFFVAASFPGRVALARGRLRGEDYATDADAVSTGVSRGCMFGADAEEAATAAQIGMGRVVERVGFENAALGGGAQGSDRAERGIEVGDLELDLDFAVCFWRLGHGEV